MDGLIRFLRAPHSAPPGSHSSTNNMTDLDTHGQVTDSKLLELFNAYFFLGVTWVRSAAEECYIVIFVTTCSGGVKVRCSD